MEDISGRRSSPFWWKGLPIELMIEILLRLPVETLIRFCLVCKLWSSIIKSPFFMSKHLKYSSSSPKIITFSEDYKISPTSGLFEFDSSLCSVISMNTFDEISNPKIPNFLEPRSLDVVGSCDGLICMINILKGDVYLWNPLIRSMLLTTKSPNHEPPGPPKSPRFVYGFGFDPQTNDYKVIELYYEWITFRVFELGPLVSVYTHNTSTWRSINEGVTRGYSCMGPNVYIDGAIHWEAFHHGRGEFAIISFNVGTENFQKIDLPTGVRRICSVMLIEKSLGILVSCPEKGSEIWVMREYGVVTSWTKLFNIKLGQEVAKLSPSLEKNSKRLLVENGEGIILYDPENHQFRRFGNFDCRSKIIWFNFVESLVGL